MAWPIRPTIICAAAAAAGVVVGSASAAFLFILDRALSLRADNPDLIYLLPLGGLLVGWLYHRAGRGVEAGTNLILDEIHDSRAAVPPRLVPLVFVGTILTHLFGGSAGREGTAVQMGGALADAVGARLSASAASRRAILVAGIAAGFGSVFGVPFAGAIFGIEVPAVGRWRWRELPGCLIASYVAHRTTLAWGIHHAAYPAPMPLILNPSLLAWTATAGVAFGLAAGAFAFANHAVTRAFAGAVRSAPLRPAVGGVLVLGLYRILGTTRYAGLGVDVIVASLKSAASPIDCVAKLFATALTLGSGFKGGEVTPLLFVGATLGSTLSAWIPMDVTTLAALGLVAVFAGAANTPLACAVMAGELFGASFGGLALLACVVSAACSGGGGIYSAQRGREGKFPRVYFGRLYMAIARSRRSE